MKSHFEISLPCALWSRALSESQCGHHHCCRRYCPWHHQASPSNPNRHCLLVNQRPGMPWSCDRRMLLIHWSWLLKHGGPRFLDAGTMPLFCYLLQRWYRWWQLQWRDATSVTSRLMTRTYETICTRCTHSYVTRIFQSVSVCVWSMPKVRQQFFFEMAPWIITIQQIAYRRRTDNWQWIIYLRSRLAVHGRVWDLHCQ